MGSMSISLEEENECWGHLSGLSPGCLWLGTDLDFPLSVECKVLLLHHLAPDMC